MLVIELKNFIKSHKFGVSLVELQKQFPFNEEVLKFFIDKWVIEGRLRKFEHKACCSSKKVCANCNALAFEFYSWVESTN